MRLLERDKQEFYFLVYSGQIDVRDNEGHKTGEKKVVYGEPQRLSAHISKAGGSVGIELFGTSVDYDKTIILTNEDSKLIDENTVFVIDKLPITYDELNSPVYDYKVKKIAKTSNITAIAISKVSND